MVVAIGVATFNTKAELSRELFIVDLESQPGRCIEPRSMRWWMEQPEESRGIFEQDGEPLDVVLSYVLDIVAKTTGILLIRKDDVAVLKNIHSRFTTIAVDIDEVAIGRVPALAPVGDARPGHTARVERRPQRLQLAARQPGGRAIGGHFYFDSCLRLPVGR